MDLNLPLHPDDVLLFNEVSAAMRRVAKNYGLPLRNITPAASVDAEKMSTALGWCSGTGDIQLLMRPKVNGVWAEQPRPEAEVYETAGHELAHLRHMNHGLAFNEFCVELQQAMRNQKEDHREKVIAKLVKLQAQRESEAQIGNSTAAEAFASAINRMLIEHELNPSDIDYARTTDRDPIIELRVDLQKYNIAKVKNRVAWQESLARIVARAHLCTFLISSGRNSITFVGTKSHATVAEYVYGTLIPAAAQMSIDARYQYAQECRRNGGSGKEARGFRESWLAAFIKRIAERFEEARAAATAEADARQVAASVPGGVGTGLMRLDGAMRKVDAYIATKYKRNASPLSGFGSAGHSEGRARGTAAANSVTIGRRGINGAAATRGAIGGK